MTSQFNTYAIKVNTAPAKPKLNPVFRRDKMGAHERMFTQSILLLQWLDKLMFENISKNIVKTSIMAELNDLLQPAFETWLITYDQADDNKAPGRTIDQVEQLGLTVVCLYDNVFEQNFKAVQSLLINAATGKQTPGSGQNTKQGADNASTGDVQMLPQDAIKAFQEAIPKLKSAIRNAPGQAILDKRFGWTAGSASIKQKRLSEGSNGQQTRRTCKEGYLVQCRDDESDVGNNQADESDQSGFSDLGNQ